MKDMPDLLAQTTPETRSQDARTPRSRFERVEKESLGRLQLTERDEALLTDLFLHQAMSRGQIQELHFGSTARCNARLRRLFDHGFLQRNFHPTAPYGSQGVYQIAARSARVVASRLDIDARQVRELCRGTRRLEFLEHTLEIVDFYLALTRAQNTLSPEAFAPRLERWLPEMRVRHEYEIMEPTGKVSQRTFKPDGFVRLTISDGHLCFFLEIDRGNASSSLFEQKIAHYREYADMGLFAEMFGADRFAVLVVTTGHRRAAHLRDLAARREAGFLWFTTRESVRSPGPFQAIWRGEEDAPFHLHDFATFRRTGLRAPEAGRPFHG